MHRAIPSTDGQAIASLTEDLLGDGQSFLGIAGPKPIRRRTEVFDLGQEVGEEPSPLPAPGGRVDDKLDFHLLPGEIVGQAKHQITNELQSTRSKIVKKSSAIAGYELKFIWDLPFGIYD